MIKNVQKRTVLCTPFVASKQWELFNVENEDVVLIEETYPHTEISSELPVALDYIDYSGNPIINRDCDIALEQQTTDLAIYEEGENRSGVFDPNLEPVNDDGTFKRLVHAQTKQAFYNSFQNPIQIFGMDNIDFQLGGTYRHITDFFRMFNINRNIYGERITEGTLELFDTALDDNATIHDDAKGNIIAEKNLFSRVQEVRPIGNQIVQGDPMIICPGP